MALIDPSPLVSSNTRVHKEMLSGGQIFITHLRICALAVTPLKMIKSAFKSFLALLSHRLMVSYCH